MNEQKRRWLTTTKCSPDCRLSFPNGDYASVLSAAGVASDGTGGSAFDSGSEVAGVELVSSGPSLPERPFSCTFGPGAGVNAAALTSGDSPQSSSSKGFFTSIFCSASTVSGSTSAFSSDEAVAALRPGLPLARPLTGVFLGAGGDFSEGCQSKV